MDERNLTLPLHALTFAVERLHARQSRHRSVRAGGRGRGRGRGGGGSGGHCGDWQAGGTVASRGRRAGVEGELALTLPAPPHHPSPSSAMSDEEHHDVHFESADAGASLTYPQQAGTVRKSGFLVIKGRPCKVADVSTSKTGADGCKWGRSGA